MQQRKCTTRAIYIRAPTGVTPRRYFMVAQILSWTYRCTESRSAVATATKSVSENYTEEGEEESKRFSCVYDAIQVSGFYVHYMCALFCVVVFVVALVYTVMLHVGREAA